MSQKKNAYMGRYFKQICLSIIIPFILCVVYVVLLQIYSVNQAETALQLELRSAVEKLEGNHENRETQAKRFILQNFPVSTALLDPHSGSERAQALYYAADQVHKSSLIELSGAGILYVSAQNDVCVGTDVITGDLTLLWKTKYASQMTYEAWVSQYLRPVNGIFYYSDSNATDNNRITRVCYNTRKGTNSYWIFCWWNEDEFIQSLELPSYSYDYCTIYNTLDEQLTAQGTIEVPFNFEEETHEGVWTSRIDNRKVFLLRHVSPETGLRYCYVVDYETVMANHNRVNNMLYVLLFLCIVISVLISIRTAQKNAKPISEISDLLGLKTESVINSNFREMTASLYTLTNKQQRAEHELMQQKNQIQQLMLKKLISDSENASLQDLQELGLESWNKYCVLMMLITIPVTDEEQDGNNNSMLPFLEIMQKSLGSKARLWQEDLHLGILLCVEDDNEAASPYNTARSLLPLLSQIPHIKVRIGIGATTDNFHDIGYCYYVARSALNMACQMDFQLYGPDVIQSENGVIYDESMETQLTTLIRAGDTAGVTALLSALYSHAKRCAPVSITMFFWGVTLSMLRLSKGFESEELTRQIDALTKHLEHFSPLKDSTNVLNSIIDVANTLCNCVGKCEQSHNMAFDEFIRAHYTDPNFGMQYMLDRFNMSQTSFQQEFKKCKGVTFGKYLESLRMTYAAEMLQQGKMNVLDIALNCGYLSDVSFRRAFKKYYGVSPTDYRKIHDS